MSTLGLCPHVDISTLWRHIGILHIQACFICIMSFWLSCSVVWWQCVAVLSWCMLMSFWVKCSVTCCSLSECHVLLSDTCLAAVTCEQLSHSNLFVGITFLVTHRDRSSLTASSHPGIDTLSHMCMPRVGLGQFPLIPLLPHFPTFYSIF